MDKAADEVIEEIIETPGLKIVNCHVAYRGAESIQINPYHELTMMPRDYIVVSASPDEILQRRSVDKRPRILEDIRVIDLHQKIGIVALQCIAGTLGSKFTLLDNHPDLTSKNVLTMRNVLGIE
jgi:adenylate kinase